MTSDQLRQVATSLRKIASEHEAAKMAQCATTLKAAHALNILRKKVTPDAR
jgi:hypothetical protein